MTQSVWLDREAEKDYWAAHKEYVASLPTLDDILPSDNEEPSDSDERLHTGLLTPPRRSLTPRISRPGKVPLPKPLYKGSQPPDTDSNGQVLTRDTADSFYRVQARRREERRKYMLKEQEELVKPKHRRRKAPQPGTRRSGRLWSRRLNVPSNLFELDDHNTERVVTGARQSTVSARATTLSQDHDGIYEYRYGNQDSWSNSNEAHWKPSNDSITLEYGM